MKNSDDEIERRARLVYFEERQRQQDRVWTRMGIVATCILALVAAATFLALYLL